jgi:hypothetical protein
MLAVKTQNRPQASSRRTPGPTPCIREKIDVFDSFLHFERRWLWVPAFAGTTTYLRSTEIMRLAKVSRSAITETK